MKYCLLFLLFILFCPNAIGGTVSRSLCAPPPSGGYCDTLIDVKITLTFPNPLSVHDCALLTIHSYAFIQVRLYNILGQLVTILADGNYPEGTYQFYFSESHISSGIYFLSVITPDTKVQKKIIYLR